VTCYINSDTLVCRCGPGVSGGSGDRATTVCTTGGVPDYKCCKGSTTCNCGVGLSCKASETSVDECRSPEMNAACPAGTTDTNTCSTSGSSKCADKGFCGPIDDRCACGLGCLHLAAGSYTCGDSCSSDSDCTSKRDPQSGALYTRCAMATFTGICS
jgi:hypothetical protein